MDVSRIPESKTRVAYLCHFSKGTTFFPEIYNYAAAAPLSFLHSLFDAKDQVWSACADIGTEHITSIALFPINYPFRIMHQGDTYFIMNSQRQFYGFIGHLRRITKTVNSQTP